MELLAGICPQCGASIEFDASLLRGFCPFCSTEFLVKDVIHGAINTLINAGETRLKLGDYPEALEKFEKACDLYPGDYRGWWGIIKVKSRNFTKTDIKQCQLDEMMKLYNKAKVVSDGRLGKNIETTFERYVAQVKGVFTGIIARTNSQIDALESERVSVINDFDKQINILKTANSNLKNPTKTVFWSVVVVVAALTLLAMFSDILTAFYVLCIGGGIGYGIIWFVNTFIAPKINRKRRKLNDDIALLEKQKSDAYIHYDSQIKTLQQKMIDAGGKS